MSELRRIAAPIDEFAASDNVASAVSNDDHVAVPKTLLLRFSVSPILELCGSR